MHCNRARTRAIASRYLYYRSRQYQNNDLLLYKKFKHSCCKCMIFTRIFFHEGVCQRTVVDLVFVVDSSGSICDNDPSAVPPPPSTTTCNNWNFIRQFMVQIVDELAIGPDDAHIAVVRFSSSATVIFNLARYVVK